MNRKIVIIHNIIAPYKVALFNELSKFEIKFDSSLNNATLYGAIMLCTITTFRLNSFYLDKEN